MLHMKSKICLHVNNVEYPTRDGAVIRIGRIERGRRNPLKHISFFSLFERSSALQDRLWKEAL